MKMMKKGWLFSILLALAMVIGLMPGMGIKAYADTAYGTYLVTSQDNAAALENKKVKFNNLEWYIIEDKSTSATEGTLTLLAAGTDFGLSMFKKQFNYYKNSIIALALADYTKEGGSFYSVADAIKEVTLSDAENLKVKLYLPSKDEVASLNGSDVLKLKFDDADHNNMLQGWGWWLRSRGNEKIDSLVSYVIGSLGTVDEYGTYGNGTGGVRPALQLKLDAVTFDSTSKTFSMNGNEVTYKVINGTWSDGSTTDKTESVQSGEKPASVPTGMKANSGYTGGAWDTDPANATITEATTFTYTFTEKQPATVTTAPSAKTLTANGSAQELVTAGVANGGTINYAIGTDDKTAPTSGWSTSIPTGTDAGTYYVWYKAVGDDSHLDSVPSCVKSTIEDIKTAVEQKENTPKAEVEGLDEELVSNLMKDEEKKKVQSGEKATLTLEMTNIDGSVSQEEKNLAENQLNSSSKNGKVGMYLDFSLWLRIGADYARQLSETGGKQLTVNLEVPENLRAPAGVTRKFFIFHIHNRAINKLAETTDIKIPIKVGEFSTFVLAYEDMKTDEAVGFYSGLKISQNNGKIKVSWDKGDGAVKYGVFVSYCGKDYSKKPVKTTKSTSVTIKKINSKKIDFTKNFKIYVAAYDSSGKQIGNTVSAHVAGKNNKKYKNAKTLKLSTKTLTLSIGKTAKIKASVKMEEGKKKDLSDGHAAKFRYRSTNKNVATVDKNGKVTGVAAGTCDVYVYSRNGLAKKVKVTVK